MSQKINSDKGYIAAEAILGIFIFIIFSGLIIILVINIYNINLSLHRTSMAINYSVEILENAKLLDYNDLSLKEGKYEGKNLFGITLSDNYTAKLNIKNYNKLEGNENKEDLIKILELNIEYQDGSLIKNIKMNTLKLNNNI